MPRNQGSQETSAFVGHPEHGVTNGSDIDPAELEPHYFTPNFLRPMPEAEDDPELDSESLYDVSNDALYLIPGMLPEPYWDLNLVSDQFNYQEMKKYLNRATKHMLKVPESK